MNTIHKYVLADPDSVVALPRGSLVLSAGAQGDDLVIWAMVNTRAEARDHRRPEARDRWRVEVYGTGHDTYFVDPTAFKGTVQMHDGLVFHVFAHKLA